MMKFSISSIQLEEAFATHDKMENGKCIYVDAYTHESQFYNQIFIANNNAASSSRHQICVFHLL